MAADNKSLEYQKALQPSALPPAAGRGQHARPGSAMRAAWGLAADLYILHRLLC